MKPAEDFSEVVKRSKIDLIEEFRKTLQDEITKAIEEADKEMINNCKKLSHENMKRSEFDFGKAFQKQQIENI